MAVRNIRFKAYHPIILMFSFVYGYSVYMYSGDITRYAMHFQQFSRIGWSDYWYLLQQSYSGKEHGVGEFGIIATQPDIYALTLQFLVSRVTENVRWFFAVVSLVYTWLFLKFLSELLPEINWTGSVPQKIFFVYLLLVVPFYRGVTGVRFWTALFLFMVFALRYVKYNRIKDIVLASISILVHFSFIFPSFLLIVVHFVKLSRLFSIVLVLSSLVVFSVSTSTHLVNSIKGTSSLFGDTRIEKRIVGYSDKQIDAQVSGKVSTNNWYVNLWKIALLYFLVISFVLEFFGVLKWHQNHFLHRLYPLYIVSFVVSLLTINLGAVFGRFQYIFFLLALARYAILCGINLRNKHLRLVSLALSPVLLLHLLVAVGRAGFYTVDPLLLVSPPFVFLFTQSSMSLSELLVGH